MIKPAKYRRYGKGYVLNVLRREILAARLKHLGRGAGAPDLRQGEAPGRQRATFCRYASSTAMQRLQFVGHGSALTGSLPQFFHVIVQRKRFLNQRLT
jgi:hypothetical protein